MSAAGSHDNRMDKLWWNEQWMGWPIGPEYAAASNVDNAHLLQGKLLLIVGEMDTNVDPSTTMQVVNALIKAHKMFDLLVIPGADHTSGGEYGDLKRWDFFVHNLLGVEPPNRNAVTTTKTARAGAQSAAYCYAIVVTVPAIVQFLQSLIVESRGVPQSDRRSHERSHRRDP